ncbi:MAG: PepSY domain-containing protein [Neisseriaceae bacterium]|nr:PepSY domain-containing protein [Neisseriaceae bacterium]
MKKTLLALTLCAVSVSAFAKPSCTAYPENERVGMFQLQQDLIKRGFEIKDSQIKNNCYRVKAKKDGKPVKMYFDMKGKPVEREMNNQPNVRNNGKSCTYYPQDKRMAQNDVQRKILNNGGTILRFGERDNCFNALVRDKNGSKVLMRLDMSNGNVVETITPSAQNEKYDGKFDKKSHKKHDKKK